MNLLITICARGGSKGVPKKNIRPIAGVPLIAYTIRHAQEYAKLTGADIALSTDSDEIKKVAGEFGLQTEYTRPAELANDTAGKVPAMRHVMEYHEDKLGKKYDYTLDLDVTSPLRTMTDLKEAFKIIDADPNALDIYSVSFPAHNPYFDMVQKSDDGYWPECIRPAKAVLSRQTAPVVYELNASYYFFRREFFYSGNEGQLTLRSLVHLTPHMCFEIDDMIQMDFLEYLITQGKLDFDFR